MEKQREQVYTGNKLS